MSNTGYNTIEEALNERDEIMACTSGTSMYPMLRNRRDMIVVAKVNQKLHKNDVPLYRTSGGKLLLHRILKVTENGYIIRGDNLYKKEYGITDKNIIGVLKAFYREGKYYDCRKSRKYRVYIFLNKVSFPLRFIWVRLIHQFLSKVKHSIIK